jgi:two-component system, cell cycle sensor histidine kinase and response regulator CckA
LKMLSASEASRTGLPIADCLQTAQKLKTAADISGGVAHAFNNLLTSVMGYVYLAQERALDHGDMCVVAQLDQATDSCRRARDLVQKLLTYSRGPRVKPEALDLLEWVREFVQSRQNSLLHGVEVTIECDGTAPTVLADRTQLDQVLANLLTNARESLAGQPGPREVQIEVGVNAAEEVCSSCRQAVRGRFAHLSVCDNGRGMEAATAARAFEPFFSTKPAGPISGMGLPVVHGIVHALHGHVTLGTLPGEGAECRVLLPVAPDPPFRSRPEVFE